MFITSRLDGQLEHSHEKKILTGFILQLACIHNIHNEGIIHCIGDLVIW